MGIRGLQSFIERNCPPNCVQRVDIAELAEDFRESHQEQPTIVFDGASILRFIYNGLDWVSGGQFTEFFEELEKFVSKFKAIGIKPVVFFGGTKHNDDTYEEWREKSFKKLEKVHELFGDLERRSADAVNANSQLFRFPVNLGVSLYLKEKLNTEIKIVAKHESEIAEYAKSKNCMAIFGQDTDFLIYEGAPYYLSAQHFDLETMTTRHYDQKNLAKHLGIRISQLPLLAALAGNNEELKRFHTSLCRGYARFDRLFPALGKYISTLPADQSLIGALPRIANRVFGDESQSEILLRSICAYLPKPEEDLDDEIDYPHWRNILKKAEELHKEGENSAVILNVMTGRPYRCSVVTEDLRRQDLPPSAACLRSLRQRMYGILLMEKPADLKPRFVEEWSPEKGDISRVAHSHLVRPTPPTDHHPGLLALWGDDRTEKMQTIRWRLFAGAISPKLDPEILSDLPENLVLPYAALFYLYEEKVLYKWEIETLLLISLILPSMSLQSLRDLPSGPINGRGVQVATIYMRSLQTTVRLMSACGFPLSRKEVYQHAYFDGKLFQVKYHQIQSDPSVASLCENKTLLSDAYRALRSNFFKET
ncbi:constitutive coactivator of peroxisome proliferator-activated receptor gamma [Bemisia tabaci]|uniref:constitutive coactivator of peroxisome proliferator-activated receptor gamma n=1 Tax=Bemisia tabaci TaxID=7038 RepID=UPI003B283BD4